MSTYNNNRFTPGNKANMRLLINKEIIRQYYRAFNTSQTVDSINNSNNSNNSNSSNSNSNSSNSNSNSNNSNNNQISKDLLCGCIQQKANLRKQGWNDPSQTENNRISQILTGTLGGRTTFGNFNRPVNINYLGSWEGQPGGSNKPLRNKF